MSEFDPARAQALLDTVRLRRPRRRRLARTPDGTPLMLEMATQPDQLTPPARRALEEEHDGDRHPHRLQDRQVAREPEDLARRQADDVARRLGRPHNRTAIRSSRSATARTRARRTTRASTCPHYNALYAQQRTLPDGARARRALSRGEEALGRLHAVQVRRPPHRNRPVSPVGGRLPPPSVHARRSGSTSTSTATNSAKGQRMNAERARAPRHAEGRSARSRRLPRPLPARAAASGREKVLRYAFEVAETGFDPAQHHRPVLAHRHRAHLRGALLLRPPGAAVQDQAAHRRRRCPRCRPTSGPGPCASGRGIYFHRRPGVQGQTRASWSPRTTSTPASASSIHAGRRRRLPASLN